MKIIQIAFAILITMFVSVSHAGLLKLNVGNGILLGADNVKVNGQFYNVSFEDGTCAGLFDGCDDVSDFVFNTQADAKAASSALLAQVFVDGSDGQFDTLPSRTFGCSISSRCAATTLFGFNDNGATGVLAANYDFEAFDTDMFTDTLRFGNDTAQLDDIVVALWEPTEVSSPNVAFIMIMGIAGLLVSQRRNKV